MVQSRLSGPGGAKSVVGALAALKPHQRVNSLLSRLAVIASEFELGRPMLERLAAQDLAWSQVTCSALSAGVFSEPGLTYASVSQAIDTVGLECVLFAMRCCNVYLIYRELEKKAPFEAKDFFRHSLGTALGAEILGEAHGLPRGLSSAAGLVRDIGLAASVSAFPSTYEAIRLGAEGTSMSIDALETDKLGFTSADVARTVLSHYGFGSHLVDAASLEGAPTEKDEPLKRAVAVGAAITAQIGSSTGFKRSNDDVPLDTLYSLGFGDELIEKAVNAVSNGLAQLGRCPFE